MTADDESPRCPPEVENLTPSAKFVYLYVSDHGPKTTREITDWLPPRTVRKAVKDLDDAGAIETAPAPGHPNTRLIRPAV